MNIKEFTEITSKISSIQNFKDYILKHLVILKNRSVAIVTDYYDVIDEIEKEINNIEVSEKNMIDATKKLEHYASQVNDLYMILEENE